MALLSLENFKLKSEQTTTLKNSAKLRTDLHGESEKERERERERERASNALLPISKTKFSIQGSWQERGPRASNDLVPIFQNKFQHSRSIA
jgi:hypothetical protein